MPAELSAPGAAGRQTIARPMSFIIHYTLPVRILQPCQCHTRRRAAHDADTSVSAKLYFGPARCARRRVASVTATVSAAASQDIEPGKHISGTPIPAFIPREDLIQQLFGWARIECEEAGITSYGLPMKVKPVHRGEGQLWGFTVSMLSREGAVSTDIRVKFDEEVVTKHQWVGRGADGFPSLEGNEESVMGDQLLIRKIDDNPIDEKTRAAIKGFCVKLVESVNKYYAFGSCFVDDST